MRPLGPLALLYQRRAAETCVVNIDRNGLEVLDRHECLRLLGHASFGRIALTMQALPTILPVNYRLVGQRIVFRTGAGTKLAAATMNAVVAFEIDHVDPLDHSGWSVVATGVARIVSENDLEGPLVACIPRWAPVSAEILVAIDIELLSGRRIGAGSVAGDHAHAASGAWT